MVKGVLWCAVAAVVGFGAVAMGQEAGKGEIAWDWSGVIGTGQSLAVGQGGKPVVSVKQEFGNLKLSTGALAWPIDAGDAGLVMVPLVEPIGRASRGYPSSWPENIAGETPHAAMANQVSAMVKGALGREFVGVHSEVGENGQGMVFLKKGAVPRGVNGRSYEAAMVETKATMRLAKAAGKTYGVGAIIVTHGENDAGNAKYEEQLRQLWVDYNTDVAAVTGQTRKILMIVSQQNAVNDRSASTLAQWKIGVNYPGEIVCSGPKYQYASGEGVHLTTAGYVELGEKYGEIYFERVVMGKPWEPLQPVGVERKGAVVRVKYHVPVGPLVWEAGFALPHGSVEEWKGGKGFEVTTAAGKKVGIVGVEIDGEAVVITCAEDPGAGAKVGYAMIGEKVRMGAPARGAVGGTFRWGLLRDSDPFKGETSGKVQPNYGVAFEMAVE